MLLVLIHNAVTACKYNYGLTKYYHTLTREKQKTIQKKLFTKCFTWLECLTNTPGSQPLANSNAKTTLHNTNCTLAKVN